MHGCGCHDYTLAATELSAWGESKGLELNMNECADVGVNYSIVSLVCLLWPKQCEQSGNIQ